MHGESQARLWRDAANVSPERLRPYRPCTLSPTSSQSARVPPRESSCVVITPEQARARIERLIHLEIRLAKELAIWRNNHSCNPLDQQEYLAYTLSLTDALHAISRARITLVKALTTGIRRIPLKNEAVDADEDGMCGRFAIFAAPHAVARFVLAPEPTFDWEQRYNLAPTQNAPVCRLDALHGTRTLSLLRWGLIPSWAKDAKAAFKGINARKETVNTNGMFRGAYRKRRCLVPINGFYEWKDLGKKHKQPFYIHHVGGELMALGGIWETWSGQTPPLETFAVITTEANSTLETLHDRMPVIVAPKDFATWLDPLASELALNRLLDPCPSDWLTYHAVDTRVGSVKNDDPGLIEPLADLSTD